MHCGNISTVYPLSWSKLVSFCIFFLLVFNRCWFSCLFYFIQTSRNFCSSHSHFPLFSQRLFFLPVCLHMNWPWLTLLLFSYGYVYSRLSTLVWWTDNGSSYLFFPACNVAAPEQLETASAKLRESLVGKGLEKLPWNCSRIVRNS